MSGKEPTPAIKPNVIQAKVKKYTPPPPNPTRPAMGMNVPHNRPGYHGDTTTENQDAPVTPPLNITSKQKQSQE